MQWEGLHGHVTGCSCPCTCLATQGEDMMVSAGEDGRINVLNVAQRGPIRTIGMFELNLLIRNIDKGKKLYVTSEKGI